MDTGKGSHNDRAHAPLRRMPSNRRIRLAFPAGTMVLMNTAAANRDPAVYTDPDRFDIAREDAPAILTFGGGVHYCLGANLARREIAEALNVLAQRMQNPRIAGPAPWKPMVTLSGPKSLPVAFDAVE